MLRRARSWLRTWSCSRSTVTLLHHPCRYARLQPQAWHLVATFASGRQEIKPRGASRHFSTSAVNLQPPEVVRLPHPSVGHLTLRIHRPSVSSDAAAQPVILYLPTGPIVEHLPDYPKDDYDRLESSISGILSAASNGIVVHVDYRLGNGHTYPSPVHQVLFAYDWAKTNLIPSRTARNWTNQFVTKLGVCGQLIGGSLATAIALTECRPGTARIGALAAHAPIVDWIFPEKPDRDEDDDDDAAAAAPNVRTKKAKPPSSWTAHQRSSTLPAAALRHTRATVFRRPASYFDPFASPVLFFRSAGADVPALPARDELTPELQSQPRRRKVPRAFPPAGSGLLLPETRLSVAADCVLADQVGELARLMRRAVARGDAGGEMGESEADRRVQVEVLQGMGVVWGLGPEETWKGEVERAGRWLQDALGR